MHKLWAFALSILCLPGLAIPGEAWAQPAQVRLALVLANSDYNRDGSNLTPTGVSELQGFVPDLRNPRNDGLAMHETLRQLGFDVTLVENATREQMGIALANFGARLDAAPADAIAVIYYSGHAIQVDGENYLIPAGARIGWDPNILRYSSEAAAALIANSTISANFVFERLNDPAVGGLNLVVVDACRNNPWEDRLYGRNRSLNSRGWAERAPRLSRTLVAFSTSPGDVAADGPEATGSNSPYTRALLRWLPEPGYNILQMLNNVGNDVTRATTQIPWTHITPVDNICLAGCQSRVAANARREQTGAVVRPTASLPANLEPARQALARMSFRDRPNDYERDMLLRMLATVGGADILSLAQSGDRRAQYFVGAALRHRIFMSSASGEALTWLRRSAAQGDAMAQFSLGDVYYEGSGVAQDFREAFSWFRQAADQGFAPAQYMVGISYSSGQGVERDDNRAVEAFLSAATQGYAMAQLALGGRYFSGDGVRRSYEQALPWLTAAADQGLASAQYYVGLMYRDGLGVSQSDSRAVAWFRSAAAQGSPNAQVILGDFFLNGRGVPTDYAQAKSWFERAAEQGSAAGQYGLGMMYDGGLGMPRNRPDAATWYRRAADQGYAAAQYRLGRLLLDGAAGLAQDAAEARHLMVQAAAGGVRDARRWLDRNPQAVPVSTPTPARN